MGGGNNQKAIYVRHASIPTFIELVTLYIYYSMLYKLSTKRVFVVSFIMQFLLNNIYFGLIFTKSYFIFKFYQQI